jgi:hypothetical protein
MPLLSEAKGTEQTNQVTEGHKAILSQERIVGMETSRNNLVVINGGYRDLDEFCVKRAIDMANVIVNFSPYPDEAQVFMLSVSRCIHKGVIELPIMHESADDISRQYWWLTSFAVILVALGEDVGRVRKITRDALSKLLDAAD